MKIGDKVRCINPISKDKNEEGIIINIDKNYIPPITVLFNKYQDLIPELGVRYLFESELEKI